VRCAFGVDQDVRGLEVAVQHPLLVGELHGLADLTQQSDACRRRESLAIAVVGDRLALDQLHHEVRASVRRAAGVEDLRHCRMREPRERAALRLETRHHPLCVEPVSHQFHRDQWLSKPTTL
jgi:hypothetical protein